MSKYKLYIMPLDFTKPNLDACRMAIVEMVMEIVDPKLVCRFEVIARITTILNRHEVEITNIAINGMAIHPFVQEIMASFHPNLRASNIRTNLVTYYVDETFCIINKLLYTA